VKLRKVIDEFAVKAIGPGFVTLVGCRGDEFHLRVRDRIAVDHELELTGCESGVQQIAVMLSAIGFREVPEVTLQ
jgi:hypothetical protein